MGPIRVLIVDDHRMFVDGLKLVLNAAKDIQIVGSSSSAEEALELWGDASLDVVIMDVQLPGMNGIEATKRFRRQNAARVVVIASSQRQDIVAAAIQAGASGYVHKGHAADELVDVIRLVAAGEIVVPLGELPEVVDRLSEVRRARSDAALLFGQLTDREVQVLEHLASARTTDEIADILLIQPETVRGHIKKILSKLGAHSRLQAVTLAQREGLISELGEYKAV